jgi:RNA polymerase sigma-70 factor (ECF subfamily)
MPYLAANDVDPTTVQRACAGDDRAFGRLIEAYQSPIYNLCYRLLGNAAEAEEAAQEAFLRAYTRLNSFDPNRSFKSWLFSIAHHYCIDRLRRRRLTWLSLDDEPLAEGLAWRATTPSPEETALRREHNDQVQAALDRLPPQYRSAVVMHYWYNLSYDEIAQTTGATVSAVKSRLHRARTALAGMGSLPEPVSAPPPRRGGIAPAACPVC